MNLRNHFGFLCYISQCEDGFCSARPQKTNKRYCCLLHQSLLIVVIQTPCCPHYHSSSQKSKMSQIFECRPLIFLPHCSFANCISKKEMEIQRVRDRKNANFLYFPGCFPQEKKNKLIKIQLSLTFSLLPFQSFYSFKSLTISVKLKGSSRHLWNGDTFDNNAFEEPVTFSPQTSLINAQTVFPSLCFFSPDSSLISLFFYVPLFHSLSLKKTGGRCHFHEPQGQVNQQN